ncbi:MAG: aminomethyl-transferring glycine dehydrogenase subunit GcvPA [Bacillati bacterium ANGP1]|uniref:Probable glycine dehydrogenase (decarboxylating) subunit 1 n=1 Tax=Candidatus Segetimicrobium genomatis TaxID=2569760 RepID=A0A537K3D8_9BACT|nr:MAG: aminomethyl-transferring glycine dehydrogenase subunit GcvPA [Terrabacteria group bacterium ANGP1]
MKYIPVTPPERERMLRSIGVRAVDDLFRDIPEEVRLRGPLDLPPALPDPDLLAHVRGLAGRNADCDRLTCFLGAGAYDHFVPSTVPHLALKPEFLTAYTPYQAELMQGELQALWEYQSLMCELTAMDVANASMYDGASATGEAAHMAADLTRRTRVLVSTAVHPEYRQVLRTYTSHLRIAVEDLPAQNGVTPPEAAERALGDDVAALIIQSPNFFGCLEDGQALAKIAHTRGALLVVAIADPISLGLVRPPGEYDADIVTGEGQALGNALNFGGPYLGMIATRESFVRRLPGRLAGRTVDTEGRPGYVLTLQTREQHIRRAKATSNICTNEALNALIAAVYLSTLGRRGIQDVAELNARKAHYARERIAALPGYRLAFAAPAFNEFVVRCPLPPEEINRRLLGDQILGGLPLGRFYPDLRDGWLVCVTETRTRAEIDRLVGCLEALQ